MKHIFKVSILFYVLCLFNCSEPLQLEAQQQVLPALTQSCNTNTTQEYIKPNDVVLWFDTSNRSTMMTTTSEGTDANTMPVVGDVVGHIYSLGAGALFINTLNNAAGKPVIDADRFLTWGSTVQQLNARNGSLNGLRSYLKIMHGVNPVWSIQFKMRVAADGSTLNFMATKTGTSTEAGWRFSRTSANKLLFQLANGTTTIASYTTTNAGFTVANGEITVQLNVNGVGTASLQITYGATDVTETFSVTGAGVDTDATTDFKVGAANFGFKHLIIRNRVLTSQEIIDFKTYNPATNENYWYSPRVKFDYDLSAYANTSLTTPSSNNGIVRAFKNLVVFPTGYVTGWLYEAASDAASPIYKTNVQNGHAGVDYDGTGTMVVGLMQAQGGLCNENNGRVIHFRVCKNRDTEQLGSHFGVGQNYIVYTSSDYPSGIYPNTSYVTLHGETGNSPAALPLKTNAQVTNLSVIQRAGANFTLWNGLKVNTTGSMVQQWRITEIGNRYSSLPSGWNLDGQDYYWEVGAGNVPNTFFTYKIDVLNITYGI